MEQRLLLANGGESSSSVGEKKVLASRLEAGSEAKKVRKKRVASAKEEAGEEEEKDGPLLHRGGVLGDLPSLSPGGKVSPDKNTLKNHSKATIDGAGSMFTADGKSKTGPRGAASRNELPKDVPPEFVCELCRKIMSDPVKSVYGNFFEATVINRWLKDQGHICPLTGAPMSDTDLTPDEELRGKIQQWMLAKSQGPKDQPPVVDPTEVDPYTPLKQKVPIVPENDDLYDF
jgi:hypothetical protein